MSLSRFLWIFNVLMIALFVGLSVHTIGQHKEDAKHIKLEKSEIRSFELIKVQPPKHFYVDIKDLATGEIISHVYVSKHCNSWRETAVVGRTYNIVVETFRDNRNGSRSIKYPSLYQVFCK